MKKTTKGELIDTEWTGGIAKNIYITGSLWGWLVISNGLDALGDVASIVLGEKSE